jgi:3-methyladenine DNA glycosylase AlkD
MQKFKELLLQYFGLTEGNIKTKEGFPHPYLGLSHPKMASFFKEVVAKHQLKDFLIAKEMDLYELRIIYAYAIGKIKSIDEALFFFNDFAPYARDWSVVDTLCQKFIIARKHQAIVFELLKQYAQVNDEFIQRIVSVVLLSHYLNDEYIEATLDLLKTLKHPGYFTKMGVAWALATINAKYPEKGIQFLKEGHLEAWTHNKAIQKSIESFRVTPENKAILKAMRIKR